MASAKIVINGRFELIEHVGTGGQAEVFKILDLTDKKMYFFNSISLKNKIL